LPPKVKIHLADALISSATIFFQEPVYFFLIDFVGRSILSFDPDININIVERCNGCKKCNVFT